MAAGLVVVCWSYAALPPSDRLKKLDFPDSTLLTLDERMLLKLMFTRALAVDQVETEVEGS